MSSNSSSYMAQCLQCQMFSTAFYGCTSAITTLNAFLYWYGLCSESKYLKSFPAGFSTSVLPLYFLHYMSFGYICPLIKHIFEILLNRIDSMAGTKAWWSRHQKQEQNLGQGLERQWLKSRFQGSHIAEGVCNTMILARNINSKLSNSIQKLLSCRHFS